jgi:hypothetical protein
MRSMTLQQVCLMMRRSRLTPTTGVNSKCKTCKQGGELLPCSFCSSCFHNEEACLKQAPLPTQLAYAPMFTWACPACFKQGSAAIQKALLRPVQRAAGAKTRKKRQKK